MSARSMSFRFDPDNQALGNSGFLYDDESATQKTLKSYFHDADGYTDYVTMHIRSVECCGWLEVSGRLDKHLKVNDLAILKLLMKEPLIKTGHVWSHVQNEPTRFPLFCVATDKQVGVKQWLLDHGWIQMSEWVNPNTSNICTSFFYPINQEEETNDES